jgi:mannose-6-phosphate isomerase-like protein (cupin superfamily)
MRLIASFLLFAAFALPAGDPEGFHLWTASEIKGLGKSLAPKLGEKHSVSQQLANVGNYSFMVAYREGLGEAEYHETQADIFFVQSGSATLLYGGTLVDGKTTAEHEMRAPSIRGAMEKKLSAGDVVTIPAKVPHQMKADKDFTYFVVKVKQ